jgi:hypothetical protein
MFRTLASCVLAALLGGTLLASPLAAQSLGPDVTSWLINPGGETGYRGIPSNVQKVQYSSSNVYVSCTCIPGYDVGPWAGNPNTPANQNFVFRLTRTPQPNTGAAVVTPLGHVGVWSNGVSIFNARDARSYNNADVWHQNAIVVEGGSFDTCLGHPAPNGEYHHHLNPRCLYDDGDSARHSPIIGYAFDGYPIYGAYGYRNADGSGGVTRMRSGYRVRAIGERTTLPDGTGLAQAQWGPAVGAQYPLGYYTEDFEYVAGLGDLDEHNGRVCVTPEYPNGTYAYFVTLDESGVPAYPYTLGPTYYGLLPAGNTGPQSGHNTPGEAVTTYTPTPEGLAPATLRSPANLARDTPLPVTLVWDPVIGAVGYRVYVDLTERAFLATTSDTTIVATGLDAGRSYTWGVTAFDSKGDSSVSARWSFTTQAASGVDALSIADGPRIELRELGGNRYSLQVALAGASDIRVALVDALGREVGLVAERSATAGVTPIDVDASALPSGRYLVAVHAGGRVSTAPLAVVR